MNTTVDFEVLLVKDENLFWNVVGISYSTSLIPDSSLSILRASILSIEKAKALLKEGKKIIIPKQTKFSEVQPDEIIIQDLDDLNSYKQCILNKINSLMHQSIIGVSLIDAMQYLTNYLKLLNAGFMITDENREDKYFEIIESAQSVEEPEPLSENSTFEEEQKYIEDKALYDKAQNNLTTLEKYLNSYDNLQKIYKNTQILQEAKDNILNASTIDEVNKVEESFKKEISKFNDQ